MVQYPNGAPCLKCGTPLGVGGSSCPKCNNGCFAAGTQVLSPSGWKAIETMSDGEKVLSFNGRSGSLKPQTILRKKVHKKNRIWEVGTTNMTTPICTTAKHSFCTCEGWKKTSQLKMGDLLIAADARGNICRNEIESVKKTDDYAEVYNLIVDGPNTFIVEGSLVHSFSYLRGLRGIWVNSLGTSGLSSSDTGAIADAI